MRSCSMRFYSNSRIPHAAAMLAAMALLLLGFWTPSPAAQSSRPHVAHLIVRGPIGPATTDYVRRAHADALAAGARAVLVELDTPGGLVTATRDLVQLYLDSPIPIITWVGPAGARAASAGTFLVYASHLAAMAPSTTIGAATPVALGASAEVSAPDAQDAAAAADEPSSAMERKAVNDAVAWIKSLAERHGRNGEWGEQAVRAAATLTASEALAQNVVEMVADTVEAVVEQTQGREVAFAAGAVPLAVAELPVKVYAPDWRNELLSIITNPQIAYILLLIGIYGLLLEGYSPGALLPGTVGVISLVIALYGLQLLPINYAGLALIALAAGLMAAEAFAPSFGILGMGGVVALAVGSLLLMDNDIPGFQLSLGLIIGVVVASAGAVLALVYFVGKDLRKPREDVRQQLVGARGRVVTLQGQPLQVLVWGERWRARCEMPLSQGQPVLVVAQDGLTLTVAPAPAGAEQTGGMMADGDVP